MVRTTLSTCVAALFVLSGCGSGGSFANKPRPATPVNLTVYINKSSVSVSPASVGAGEVVFIVTNQADRAESLTVRPADSSTPLASTGPINPQGTSQVAVNFTQPGDYAVATVSAASTDATATQQTAIQPALLRVGKARPNSRDQLLQP
jgi:hypothetical protein